MRCSHSLLPLDVFVPMCDRCLSHTAEAVYGCRNCNYAVCKWCFLGGEEVVSTLLAAEKALAQVRNAVERIKAEIDDDLYVWV